MQAVWEKKAGIKGAELVAKMRSEIDTFFFCFFKVKFLINLTGALSAASVCWSI